MNSEKHMHPHLRILLWMYCVCFWTKHSLFAFVLTAALWDRHHHPTLYLQKLWPLEIKQLARSHIACVNCWNRNQSSCLPRQYITQETAFIASEIERVLQVKQQIYISCKMLDFHDLFGFGVFSVTLLLVDCTLKKVGDKTRNLQKLASDEFLVSNLSLLWRKKFETVSSLQFPGEIRENLIKDHW